MKWELCKQPFNIQIRQEIAFENGVVMLTFKSRMYYFSPAPRYLESHYDQTNCKRIYANSIMSNVTMKYDPIRKIYLLNPVDAKSLDEFV